MDWLAELAVENSKRKRIGPLKKAIQDNQIALAIDNSLIELSKLFVAARRCGYAEASTGLDSKKFASVDEPWLVCPNWLAKYESELFIHAHKSIGRVKDAATFLKFIQQSQVAPKKFAYVSDGTPTRNVSGKQLLELYCSYLTVVHGMTLPADSYELCMRLLSKVDENVFSDLKQGITDRLP